MTERDGLAESPHICAESMPLSGTPVNCMYCYVCIAITRSRSAFGVSGSYFIFGWLALYRDFTNYAHQGL
jgi:hypothetical protein